MDQDISPVEHHNEVIRLQKVLNCCLMFKTSDDLPVDMNKGDEGKGKIQEIEFVGGWGGGVLKFKYFNYCKYRISVFNASHRRR